MFDATRQASSLVSPVREAATHGLVFEIHVSQRPTVCIFDNEAFAVLNYTPGRGKPTWFGRLSHQSTYFLKCSLCDPSQLNGSRRP